MNSENIGYGLLAFFILSFFIWFIVLTFKEEKEKELTPEEKEEEKIEREQQRLKKEILEKELKKLQEEEERIEKEQEQERLEQEEQEEQERLELLEIEQERINKLRWIYCNKQNGKCNKIGKIKYGQGDKWSYLDNPDGNLTCNNTTFGNVVPGIAKKCFYKRDEPYELEEGGRCGEGRGDKRCVDNRYCSTSGYCGTSTTHKNNSVPQFSGPDTHWYVY